MSTAPLHAAAARRARGFTLVELMIVVLIGGMIAAPVILTMVSMVTAETRMLRTMDAMMSPEGLYETMQWRVREADGVSTGLQALVLRTAAGVLSPVTPPPATPPPPFPPMAPASQGQWVDIHMLNGGVRVLASRFRYAAATNEVLHQRFWPVATPEYVVLRNVTTCTFGLEQILTPGGNLRVLTVEITVNSSGEIIPHIWKFMAPNIPRVGVN